MSKNGKVILGVVIVVALGLLIISNKKQNQSQSDSFKVGVIAPLTGDAASYGEPAVKLYQLAVKNINDNGGINGKKMELSIQDGKCDAGAAVSAAKQLIDIEKVKVIIGGFCSGESLAVIPSAEAAKVAMYNAASSNPGLSGKSRFFTRNYPSDSAQGTAMAEYANKQGWKKAAILVEQTDYALGVQSVFSKRFAELGGTEQKEEFAKEGTDFRTQLTKLKDTNPDFLVLSVQTSASGERVAKQLNDLNFHPKILMVDVMFDEAMIVNNKDALEGATGMQLNVSANPKSDAMNVAYKAAYGVETPYATSYAVTEYDIVYMLADALKTVGYDGEKLADFARTFKDWDGASGKVTIDPATGDRVNAEFAVKTVKAGKIEVVK